MFLVAGVVASHNPSPTGIAAPSVAEEVEARKRASVFLVTEPEEGRKEEDNPCWVGFWPSLSLG